MSLRRLYVLISNLPPESHVWAVENGVPYGWTPQVAITADVFHALAGEPHPATPKSRKHDSSAIADRLRKQKERLAARNSSAS